MRVKMSKQPPPAPTATAVGPCPTYPNCRMPRHWKFTQLHRTTRPPPALMGLMSVMRVNIELRKGFHCHFPFSSGSSCSKLTMSLVNVSLKFQMLISENCQNFLLKKCEKLLQKLLSFFQQKISVYLVIKS